MRFITILPPLLRFEKNVSINFLPPFNTNTITYNVAADQEKRIENYLVLPFKILVQYFTCKIIRNFFSCQRGYATAAQRLLLIQSSSKIMWSSAIVTKPTSFTTCLNHWLANNFKTLLVRHFLPLIVGLGYSAIYTLFPHTLNVTQTSLYVNPPPVCKYSNYFNFYNCLRNILDHFEQEIMKVSKVTFLACYFLITSFPRHCLTQIFYADILFQ